MKLLNNAYMNDEAGRYLRLKSEAEVHLPKLSP